MNRHISKEMAVEPLLISVEHACQLIGVGKTLFYSMASSGALGPQPIRFGRRTVYRYDELTSWVAAGCPHRRQWLAMRGKR